MLTQTHNVTRQYDSYRAKVRHGGVSPVFTQRGREAMGEARNREPPQHDVKLLIFNGFASRAAFRRRASSVDFKPANPRPSTRPTVHFPNNFSPRQGVNVNVGCPGRLMDDLGPGNIIWRYLYSVEVRLFLGAGLDQVFRCNKARGKNVAGTFERIG